MSTTLLEQLLALPEAQRAELARKLLESLEVTPAPAVTDWHTPWIDELERRRRELASCAQATRERMAAAFRSTNR